MDLAFSQSLWGKVMPDETNVPSAHDSTAEDWAGQQLLGPGNPHNVTRKKLEEESRKALDEIVVGAELRVVPPTTHGDRLVDGLADLLRSLNSSPETVTNTPQRFLKAFREMTCGYQESPKEILSTQFDEHSDDVVILRGVECTSLCEHHLLPFVGTVDVGYLPGENGKVVGLSKLARLVDCFARRLQIQERMTKQIAESLMEWLGARGAAVVVRAHHSCMGCRGVRKSSAEMVTSCTMGLFRTEPTLRAEFLELTSGG